MAIVKTFDNFKDANDFWMQLISDKRTPKMICKWDRKERTNVIIVSTM